MTPEQKFRHAITVRNRTLGPVKGTQVSPYLDVEITEDNKKFIAPNKDDLNMYRVLQMSTCKREVRRKVAKRSLNMLGDVSGVCGILNGSKEMKELKAGLKFAESLEHIRHDEKKRKHELAVAKKKLQDKRKQMRAEQLAKRTAKAKEVYAGVLAKLDRQDVLKKHVQQLTGPQLKVCGCACNCLTCAV